MRFSFNTLWQRLLKLRGAQAALFLLPLAIGFLALSFLIRAGRIDEDDYEITQALQHAVRSDPKQWFVPIVDNIAGFFTFLGNSLSLTAVIAVVAVALWVRGRRHAAVLSVVTLIGLPLNMLLKDVVGRPRPDRNIVEVLLPTVGLSYPSGHAMASTMVYGFIAALLWIHAGPRKMRRWATIAVALLPPIVSLSRIYVGAHYFSDVIGGMTAGLFCLIILLRIYRRWTHEGPAPVAADPRDVGHGAPAVQG